MKRNRLNAAQWTTEAPVRRLAFGALIASTLASPALPQNAPPPRANASPPQTVSPQVDAKKSSETPATAAAAATDPRQAQILSDSQKLLKLSQELKAEVAKSNKDTLSIAVIKKAEEVEKLAKTLKEEINKAKQP